MKTLTKMIAVGAAMGSMHFAKAEEKEFFPVAENNAEIERIAIVNGQLEVHAPGAEIEGVKTPYMYVSTNTTNFASAAFAQGGLENVDTYTHLGNGKIYMTEKGNQNDFWTTEIKAAPAALNGVTSTLNKNEGLGNDALSEVAIQSVKDGFVTKIFNGQLYRVENEELRKGRKGVYTYDTAEQKWVAQNILATIKGTIKDVIDVTPDGFGGVNCYTLVEEDANHETYLYKDFDKVENSTDPSLTALSSLPKDVKSAAISNNIMYYATAKKLGYVNIHE